MSLSDKIRPADHKDGGDEFFWAEDVREAVRELKKRLIEEYGIKYREARNSLDLIDEIFGEKLI